MYILATRRTKAHPTPHTCIVGSRTTHSAEVAAGGRAWRSHCCLQIGRNMRRQGVEICLFWREKSCKERHHKCYLNCKKNTGSIFPITSCTSSRNVLGAFLASRAFACRVLRLVPLECFFCIYTAAAVETVICLSFNPSKIAEEIS